MPNRIIKESICTSDSVDQMTWFEECFWQRLIVNCDDYGRFDGRISVIKARLFPLKEKLQNREIEAAIEKLVSLGCIVLYWCDGKPYLYIPAWESHQTIRAHKSKYPSPDSQDSASEIICTQEKSEENKSSRNPIQSESNPNPNTIDGFDDFWKAYPRKTAKEDARKAYAVLMKKKDAPTIERLIESIEAHKRSEAWKKDDGQFIPHPATYIRQGRYDDEIKDKNQSGARKCKLDENGEIVYES